MTVCAVTGSRVLRSSSGGIPCQTTMVPNISLQNPVELSTADFRTPAVFLSPLWPTMIEACSETPSQVLSAGMVLVVHPARHPGNLSQLSFVLPILRSSGFACRDLAELRTGRESTGVAKLLLVIK